MGDSSLRTANHSSRIKVVYRSISDLKMEPRNPRVHDRKQVRQIARSIREFGFIVAILVDANLKLIAGHGRLLAAQNLGLTEVPTVMLEHLTEAQVRAFMIADNRLTENSRWDEHLLAENLRDLSVLDLDFSIEITGFEMPEIDSRIEGLTSGGDAQKALADTIPAATDAPAVSRVGDLWLLRDHRVFCGSALDDSSYTTLMVKKKATMVFTDPPYNVPIDGNVSGRGAVHHREFSMGCGEMNESEFSGFLIRACSLLARHTTSGSIHFVCMDWRHMNELLAAGRSVYAELKNVCVWVKHNAGMGSLYRSQHEMVFVFISGQASHRNNVQLGRYERNRTNVWNYPGVNAFGGSEERHLLALHPTIKPQAMVADAILDVSARGDVVLDAFLGSGTTLIAAERVGRHCYGLEIEPRYVDLAIRCRENLTGGVAVRADGDRRFKDLEQEAREVNGR